ncbi:GLUG domain protein [Anaerohalosphaera lusitana]|uniref:GLUG domain protein n=2 Tax=Anaerohalosphaera lusitana TaxID=1936003 RepID=A0A1U9NHV6_9BACT|nr:GLUG domain protein [Anaerohalosphaera lusitana]
MQLIAKFLVVAVVFTTSVNAFPALPGSGTAADPWRIESRADFDEFAADSSYWAGHTRLETDIDLAGTVYTQAVIAPDDGQLDDQFGAIAFTGNFNGANHTIENLNLGAAHWDYVGLFGKIEGADAEIKNINLQGCNVSGYEVVGALCASNDGGTISYCRVDVDIRQAHKPVGGLCGKNSGLIIGCKVQGSVSSYTEDVAGVCGRNYGSIRMCLSTVSVSGENSVGGICGSNYGEIQTCYSSGDIEGYSFIGGLCGSNSGTITDCYSSGHVESAYEKDGGLCGYNFVEKNIVASFWDVETSGLVNSFGGKGLSTQEMKSLYNFQNAGWSDSGWVMSDGEDYPRLVWESRGYPAVPEAVIPLAGSGTSEDPYQICGPSDLACLSTYAVVLNSHIQLMSDIDMQGVPLRPIGELGTFSGVFDGNGHNLMNVTIEQVGKNSVGLFDDIGPEGQVKEVTVENATITGNNNCGVICGANRGLVRNCVTSGTVTGNDNVGGLCGNAYDGTISDCSSTGEINGGISVGGLCGNTTAEIVNCYAEGHVNGSKLVGGFCGCNYGTIRSSHSNSTVTGNENVGGFCGLTSGFDSVRDCYANGLVTGNRDVAGFSASSGYIYNSYSTCEVTGAELVYGFCDGSRINTQDCFWDIESSGVEDTNGGGQGLTTADLQNRSTFENAGWTFCNLQKGAPGWFIPKNGYPIHNWEVPDTTQVPVNDGTWSEVQNRLSDAGFSVETVYVDSKTVPEGQMTGLSVLGGGYIEASMPIKIYISKGNNGDGTVDAPYGIACQADLEAVNNDMTANYRMVSDIFMNYETLYTSAVIAADADGCTEQFDGEAFTGSFDGNGYSVYFLKISEESNYLGLFGFIALSGRVDNLGIDYALIGGKHEGTFIGGLCGLNEGTVSNCHSSGKVWIGVTLGGLCGINKGLIEKSSSTARVITSDPRNGGLCGLNEGTINNCFATGAVDGYSFTGGLCGLNKGTITKSYTSGLVENTLRGPYIGGFCGHNSSDGNIADCYATGSVITFYDHTGGFCGRNQGLIKWSFANVNVSGRSKVGGFCGSNSNSEIRNCYATGLVTGDKYVGGFCGYNLNDASIAASYFDGEVSADYDYAGGFCALNLSDINNCYASGSVSGEDLVGGFCALNDGGNISKSYSACSLTGDRKGGFCVGNLGTTFANFWNVEMVDSAFSIGGIGLTTAEMQTRSTFTDAGWDFVGENANGTADVWRMCVDGVDYPRLWWEFAAGDFACPDGVSFSDYALLADTWLLSEGQPGFDSRSDLDADGTVGLGDLTVFVENWLE